MHTTFCRRKFISSGLRLSVAVLFMAVLVAPASAIQSEPSYSVDVFDVGTGLSVLVRGPAWNVLFDGGSNDESDRHNRLLELIPAAGLAKGSRLDYVILSHPHTDHELLLDDVFENYKVGEVWDSGEINQVCSYYQFVKAIEASQKSSSKTIYRTTLNNKGDHHMPVFTGHSCFGSGKTDTPQLNYGEQLIGAEASDKPTQVEFPDGARMTLLYATDPHAPDFRDNDKSYNDFSFVVSLVLGEKTVLLMGDAQGGPRETPLDHHDVDHTIEKKLLDCCMKQLPADFMVVGHHGSETSSRNEFLDAVDGRRETADQFGAPTGANQRTMHYVISAGPHKYSSVRLPDADVVDDIRARFSNPDEHVWRTDLHDLACNDKSNVKPCPSDSFTPCKDRPIGPTRVGSNENGLYGGCNNVKALITGSKLEMSYWP